MNFFIFEQIIRERKESCSCMMHNYMGYRKWNRFLKNINQITFLVFAGIYKNDGPFDVMINITKIEKLHTIPSVTEVHYLL